MRTTSSQSGFTLLELLVVIAVLGTLSGVVVFGVSAFGDQAQRSACGADARAIATAQAAALLDGGAYLDEDALVSSGYLGDASTLHDITVAGELYSIDPVGDCVDATSEELAAAEPSDDEAAAALAEKKAAAKEAAEREKTAEEKAAAEKADADKDAEEKKEAAEKEAAATEAAEKEAAAKEAAESGTSSCTKGQVDLNSASHKDLKTIDHVGGDEATRIIKQRPFTSLDQLSSIKGLSEKDVADIRKEGRACV